MALSILSRDELRKAVVDDDSITYYRAVSHGCGGQSWRFERRTTPNAIFRVNLETAEKVLNAPPRIGAAARH